MVNPQFFTFSSKDIKYYEEECEEKIINERLHNNIHNILGNFEEDHLSIIINNMNDDDTINWDNISKNEILDDQFIHNYNKDLNWSNIVKYQVLSKVTIKNNAEIIGYYNLWKKVIQYQKLHYTIIEYLYNKDMDYWGLLVIHQKIEKEILCDMIKEVQKLYPEQLSIFNKLIAKYQS